MRTFRLALTGDFLDENGAPAYDDTALRLLDGAPFVRYHFLTEQAHRFAFHQQRGTFVGVSGSPVPPAADPALRAREDLIHVLMNHHEFVTVR